MKTHFHEEDWYLPEEYISENLTCCCNPELFDFSGRYLDKPIPYMYTADKTFVLPKNTPNTLLVLKKTLNTLLVS